MAGSEEPVLAGVPAPANCAERAEMSEDNDAPPLLVAVGEALLG
jgi:hypothetical protein